MESKTRVGRNPFERSVPPISVFSGAAQKKRVLNVANKKESAGESRTQRTQAAESPLFFSDFVFRYAIEIPTLSALFAMKAWMLTFAVARDLTEEAREMFRN